MREKTVVRAKTGQIKNVHGGEDRLGCPEDVGKGEPSLVAVPGPRGNEAAAEASGGAPVRRVS